MTCQSCVKNITMVFAKKSGVHCSDIVLDEHSGRFWYDPSQISQKEICDSIQDIGFEANILSSPLIENSSDVRNEIFLIIYGESKEVYENVIPDNFQYSKSLGARFHLFKSQNEESFSQTCQILNDNFYDQSINGLSGYLKNSQIFIPIHGLHCNSCVRKIQNHFQDNHIRQKCLISNSQIDVNLKENLLTLDLRDDVNPNISEVKAEIENLGFKFHSRQCNDESIIVKNDDSESRPNVVKEIRKTCFVKVSGMTCSSCVYLLENHLLQIKGVVKVIVALLAGKAEINYDPAFTSPSCIVEAVKQVGFGAEEIPIGDNSIDEFFSRLTMKHIENVLSDLDGVKDVEFNKKLSKVKISFDQTKVGPRRIFDTLQTLGYKASVYQDNSANLDTRGEIDKWKRSFFLSLIFCIPLMVTMMVSMFIWKHDTSSACSNATHNNANSDHEEFVYRGVSITNVIMFLLATPVQIFCTKYFYVHAWKSLYHGMTNMDVLIALATFISYTYSVVILLIAIIGNYQMSPKTFFETSVMLTTFISLGRWLEKIAKGKTSEVLSELINLKGIDAVILEDANGIPIAKDRFLANYDGKLKVFERKIHVDLVQRNDLIKILPGEKVPVDGKVIKGESTCDESMLTGESMPVDKSFGYDVIGGSMNIAGLLIVEATNLGNDSALNQIVNLIQSAQMSKAKIQQTADKISAYFIPSVCLISFTTLIVWLVIGTYWPNVLPGFIDGCRNLTRLNVENAFYLALSVLSIACPCSLGLATPTAVMVSSGIGAKNGILIKGGEALENLGKINVIFFDKTGTITVGRPKVSQITIVNPVINNSPLELSINRLLLLVASTENATQHPIGSSICRLVKTLRMAHSRLSSGQRDAPIFAETFDTKTEVGMGVECKVKVMIDDCPNQNDLPRYTKPEIVQAISGDDKQNLDQERNFDLDYSSRVVVTNLYNQIVVNTTSSSSTSQLPNYSWTDVKSSGTYEVHVGSLKMLRKAGLMINENTIFHEKKESMNNPITLHEVMTREENHSKTVILIAVERQLVAIMSIEDPIKSDASLTVYALKRRGIESVLLTGDNSFTAQTIAKKVGIETVYSKVLPAHKVERIKTTKRRKFEINQEQTHHQQPQGAVNSNDIEIGETATLNGPMRRRRVTQADGIISKISTCLCSFICLPKVTNLIFNTDANREYFVAMVGDGINDSPALAEADVGIAIGRGADVAVEAADIVLSCDRLIDVVVAIDLSRKTLQRIKQNFFAATIYNLVAVPVAAGVLIPIGIMLSPWIASICMALSSLSVISLSLLLKKWKKPTESSLVTEEFIGEYLFNNTNNYIYPINSENSISRNFRKKMKSRKKRQPKTVKKKGSDELCLLKSFDEDESNSDESQLFS